MNEGYIYHILMMAAYLWPEGQRVEKDPATHIRLFLENNFGKQAAIDGIEVLNTLKSQNRMMIECNREDAVYTNLLNAGINFTSNTYETSMGLLAFYMGLACEIWGASIDSAVKEKLYTIAGLLGLESKEVDILLDMTKLELSDPRITALKILNLPPSATNEDIKVAYRRLSLKYHPDRNAAKSEAEKKEAEQKFKEIVAAKQVLDNIH